MSGDLVDSQTSWPERDPAEKASFIAQWLEDCLEGYRIQNEAMVVTRSQAEKNVQSETGNVTLGTGGDKEVTTENKISHYPETQRSDIAPQEETEDDTLDSLPITQEYWGALHPRPKILLGMDEMFVKQWKKVYAQDPNLRSRWNDSDVREG